MSGIYNISSEYRNNITSNVKIFTVDIDNLKIYIEKLNKSNNEIRKLIEYILTNNDFTEFIQNHYKYSIFPTVNQVLRFYNQIKTKFVINTIDILKTLITKKFTISQSDLFHYFPGIYYNISCRSLCNSSQISAFTKLHSLRFMKPLLLTNSSGGRKRITRRKKAKRKNKKTRKQ